MNYTHNEKNEQATDTTMVVGVDIGSQTYYARDFVYSRDRIMKQHNISANRIHIWLAIHFLEYLGLYTRFGAASGLQCLKKHHYRRT